uniref:Pco148683 n=1 Tax=Arundo donax TaxID=35708 RepID=A0A0A9HTU7_ARUDO
MKPLSSLWKFVTLATRSSYCPSSRSGVQTVLLDRSSGGISTSFAGAKRVEYPLKQKAGKFCNI